jgi:hypothetical protein
VFSNESIRAVKLNQALDAGEPATGKEKGYGT